MKSSLSWTYVFIYSGRWVKRYLFRNCFRIQMNGKNKCRWSRLWIKSSLRRTKNPKKRKRNSISTMSWNKLKTSKKFLAKKKLEIPTSKHNKAKKASGREQAKSSTKKNKVFSMIISKIFTKTKSKSNKNAKDNLSNPLTLLKIPTLRSTIDFLQLECPLPPKCGLVELGNHHQRQSWKYRRLKEGQCRSSI